MDWTLAQFGSRKTARQAYRKFVADGKGSRYAPWEQLTSQIFLGGEEFRKTVQTLIGRKPLSTAIPRDQRVPVRPTLQAILHATAEEFGASQADWTHKRRTPARLALAWLAATEGGLRLADFGPALGVQPWAASHLAAAAQRRAASDRRFRKSLDRIQDALYKITTSRT